MRIKFTVDNKEITLQGDENTLNLISIFASECAELRKRNGDSHYYVEEAEKYAYGIYDEFAKRGFIRDLNDNNGAITLIL